MILTCTHLQGVTSNNVEQSRNYLQLIGTKQYHTMMYGNLGVITMLIVKIINMSNGWNLYRLYYRDKIVIELWDDIGRLRETVTNPYVSTDGGY